jgi:hypothetical protein
VVSVVDVVSRELVVVGSLDGLQEPTATSNATRGRNSRFMRTSD